LSLQDGIVYVHFDDDRLVIHVEGVLKLSRTGLIARETFLLRIAWLASRATR
jgi:hypothetical protein